MDGRRRFIPVYTRGEALQLQRLTEFDRGLIQWGQGAVTRANDGRLAFDRHKVIRRGHNLFLDQPLETLSNIIETLPAIVNKNMDRSSTRTWIDSIYTSNRQGHDQITKIEQNERGIANISHSSTHTYASKTRAQHRPEVNTESSINKQ